MATRRLRDDPLLRLSANPAFMMGMAGLQASLPGSGAANTLGGFSQGLAQSMKARASLLQPDIDAEEAEIKRNQTLQDAKELYKFQQENKAPAAPKMPSAMIQNVNEYFNALNAGDTEKAALIKDQLKGDEPMAEILRAVFAEQSTKALASKSEAMRDDFRRQSASSISFMQSAEDAIRLAENNPAALTVAGGRMPAFVRNLGAETDQILNSLGMEVESGAQFENLGGEDWGELADASAAMKRLRYDLALQYVAATQPGSRVTDRDVRDALRQVGTEASLDQFRTGLRSLYPRMVRDLQNQTNIYSEISDEFRADLFQPFLDLGTEALNIDTSSRQDQALSSFQASFPEATALPKSMEEAGAMGLPVAESPEVAEMLNLPKGTWVWIETPSGGRLAVKN